MNEKQVDAGHYRFGSYMSQARWGSLWYQIDELSKLDVHSVLEIGPGPGYLSTIVRSLGMRVETVDLDPDLKPDHVGSVSDLPLPDNSFDVACAFQVLEHIPFEEALRALDELARVARRFVLISLPNASHTWRYLIHLPKLGEKKVLVPRPRIKPERHTFDGEHYWELGKEGYRLSRVVEAFRASERLELERTYRPFDNPYHQFFLFSVMDSGAAARQPEARLAPA